MASQNLDGISIKRNAGTVQKKDRFSPSKKIDGLVGVVKKRTIPEADDNIPPVSGRSRKTQNGYAQEPPALTQKKERINPFFLLRSDILDFWIGFKKKLKIFKKKSLKKTHKIIRNAKAWMKRVLVRLSIHIAWALGASATVYLLFCLFVLTVKPSGNFFKSIPVPAVITDKGIISYEQYQKYRSLDNNLSVIAKNRFLKLYGLAGADPAKKELNDLVMKDEGINETAIARIMKIKNEIVKFGFDEVYMKYGDEYEDGAYISREEAKSKFNDTLTDYASGQVSPILYGQGGYYIAEVVDGASDPIGIKYVFVKARTFDEYLDSEVKKIKHIRLIR